ncbi:MAG: HD domain-containing phosphohydrolase [Patescibacteria group bacterium]
MPLTEGLKSVPYPEKPNLLPHREAIDIVFKLLGTLRHKERYKFKHACGSARLMLLFSKAQKFKHSQCLQAILAGFLHDVGKVKCRSEIWEKPRDRLNDSDWAEISQHPILGAKILHKIGLRGVEKIVHSHHEKWNGDGYPDGLNDGKIPLLARMLKIVDSYDAMIHPHGHNSAKTSEQAIAIIKQQAGETFDPELVKIFVKMLER